MHLSGTLDFGWDERLMKPIDHSRPIPDLDRSSEFGSVNTQYLGNGHLKLPEMEAFLVFGAFEIRALAGPWLNYCPKRLPSPKRGAS